MFRLTSHRSRQLIQLGLLGIAALLTGMRIVEYESSPWGLVLAFAVVTALIFGPITWSIRDRISKEQRRRLSYVATGVVLLCVPLVIGLGLIIGGLLLFIDAGVFGSIIGFAVTLFVERTGLPERFRGATQ